MTLARAICVARGNDVARGHKEQRNRREFRLCILCDETEGRFGETKTLVDDEQNKGKKYTVTCN